MAATREKLFASSPVHSRLSSPYVATAGSIMEKGLRVPTTW